MKWFNKKNKKTDDEPLTKTVKCFDCEMMFEPFDILDTKEGKSLCKNVSLKKKKNKLMMCFAKHIFYYLK